MLDLDSADTFMVERNLAPPLFVGIDVHAPEGEGVDLQTKTPSILIQADGGKILLALTWREARQIATCLIKATDIAEHG